MRRKATIQDFELELWIRERNSGAIYWTTRDGRNIPIKDMDDNHVVNTINMLVKKAEEDDFREEHAFETVPMDYYD